jgi:hypothetical protein
MAGEVNTPGMESSLAQFSHHENGAARCVPSRIAPLEGLRKGALWTC